MRFGSWMAVAGVAAMMGTGAAQAAPGNGLAPGASNPMLQTAVDTGPAPQVELVRGGCGYHRHRTVYGCRLNRHYYRHGRVYYRYYR